MPSNTFSSSPSSLTVNNETFINPTAIANQLNHYFVNICESLVTNSFGSNDNGYFTFLKSPCSFSIYFYPTTPSEIINMIRKLIVNKANGHDDIMPFFFNISANKIFCTHPLCAILNQCLAFGYFPIKSKITKVIPVYKVGPTYQPGSYRPISLLPSMSKIFERLILNRHFFFQRTKILIPTQFVFRHNHSTLDSSLDIMTECYDSTHFKRFSILLFLDIKKAFDSVCHKKNC